MVSTCTYLIQIGKGRKTWKGKSCIGCVTTGSNTCYYIATMSICFRPSFLILLIVTEIQSCRLHKYHVSAREGLVKIMLIARVSNKWHTWECFICRVQQEMCSLSTNCERACLASCHSIVSKPHLYKSHTTPTCNLSLR